MSRWFRHYAGMMRDEKLVRAAMKSRQAVERVVWVWGAALESAAEINDAGRFDLDVEEAAYFLRCDPSDLTSILDALRDLGRLDADRVTKWGERQFESDTSRERQQRYRDKRKASLPYESDVTQPSRNGGVTRQETKAETDTKAENINAPSVPEAAGARVDFGDVWEAFPRNPSSSETKAEAAWNRTAVADRPQIVTAAQRYSRWFAQDCEQRGRTLEAGERFVPHLAKWLDSGEWREAGKLIVKGEADPSLAIVAVGTADFEAVKRFRKGKLNVYSDKGTVTVPVAELEAARAQAVH